MITIEEIMKDRITPRWARDVYGTLPKYSQYIFSGNIRDSFLVKDRNEQGEEQYIPTDIYGLLWKVLQARGFKRLEVYDPIDGLRIYPDKEKTAPVGKPPEKFADEIRDKLECNERIAVVIDFASRIEHDNKIFSTCEKLSTTLKLKYLKEKNEPYAFYNPLIWLFNRDADIPPWFGIDNHKIYRREIPKPDYDQRLKLTEVQLPAFNNGNPVSDSERQVYSKQFADMTDGFTLSEIIDVGRLAKTRSDIGLTEIDDVVRSYKSGDPSLENPWKSGGLRKRLSKSEEVINQAVLGQPSAVRQAFDILKRSIMGLTGAQASSSNNRPRGVLFLAGPTGVGKTELAKSLTRELFGDQEAYIRFDMSEFSQEHSDARLLGAPPGYVGYESGGELTRAIRQRPFSLILFDEIEKANGKILDKFLQILEDGRITDGRGDTVYFSESIIVFTSNIGVYKDVYNERGDKVDTVPMVTWEDDYQKVFDTINKGVKDHFTNALRRPELLNRLGNNIVIFNFIKPDIADKIFDMMLAKIEARMQDEHTATLMIDEEPKAFLRTECTKDLTFGGRGIGNSLETTLINPLSRRLFEVDELKNKTITVTGIKRISETGPDSEVFDVTLNVQDSCG